MGLYDEFLTRDQEVFCPGCAERLPSLQTKSLPDPALRRYGLGDMVAVETRDGLAELVLQNGQILCYTSCDTCRTWSNSRAVIEDNRWARTELVDWHRVEGQGNPIIDDSIDGV